MHDLLIRNVRLCDGLGSPLRDGELAVNGGRIAAMGEAVGPAREVVDGAGMVLAPGFVDIHTHYDAQLTWDPSATPSPELGVTTVVIGNCGFTIAPCRPEDRRAALADLTKVEGMPIEALSAGVTWNFETFPEYLAALERRGVTPNVACFAGHSAIRSFVMGGGHSHRLATDAEIAGMTAVLREALDAGAIGFATSTLELHNGDDGQPMPSRFASHDEFRAFAEALREAGRGVFQITKGLTTDVPFLTELARLSGRPVHVCPMLIDPAMPDDVFRQMDRIAQAQSGGCEIYGQVSPFTEIMNFTLAEPYPLESLRAWHAERLAASRAARIAAYRDASFRAGLKAEIATPPVPFRFNGQWDAVEVTGAAKPGNRAFVGRSLAALAAERGVDPLDFMLDLALDEDLETAFRVVSFNGDVEEVRRLLEHPSSVVGLGDAGAHLNLFCQAGTGLYMLQRHVRERGDFTLPQAIRMLTSRAADTFRIADRGRLAVGAHADLLLFDPETVGLGPMEMVRDLPAGQGRLTTPALGVAGVWVNGVRVADESGLSSETPRAGRVIREFRA
jgi:N-acyl-D-aspartate/D-glutamate deacylase